MQIFNIIHFQNLKGDLFGGVTAAIIALPMALAFGVASGAGAEAGLYGAILVGLFAALFGGTPTLISEPTGPMTVVFTAVIASLIAANPENGMAMAFTVVIMAGLFQILFGFLKLGKYVTLMPYTVVSGFMTGIGFILIILQMAPFLGHASPPGGVVGTLESVPDFISNIQTEEAILAALTLAILFFTPSRMKRYLPPQLVALVVGTVISLTIFGAIEIRRIGEIPTGLPDFQMPVFTAEQWQVMLLDAIVLGMLGCIDALLSAVISDSLTKHQHNSNKELIGQGLGNVASGLFGGLPGSGATMGTVVNIQTGARTALSGVTRALILLVVVVWAADLTASIPLAVLAGIAMKVGFDIIDWKFLKRAHRISPKAAIIMYGVIILTVFVDLITAVGIGLFIANIMTVRRLSDMQSNDIQTITCPKEAAPLFNQDEMALFEKAGGHITLFHLTGPMIFGSAKAISRKNIEIESGDAVILDLSNVPHLGVSSSLALEETIVDNMNANRRVYVVGAQAQPKKRLNALGALGLLPESHVVDNRITALRNALDEMQSASGQTAVADEARA